MRITGIAAIICLVALLVVGIIAFVIINRK